MDAVFSSLSPQPAAILIVVEASDPNTTPNNRFKPDPIAELIHILHQQNYRVAHVESGYQLERTVQQFKPDVIILGHRLDLESLSLCHVLTQHPDSANIPILFLVEQDCPWPVGTILQAGAADFLSVPFTCWDVCTRVEHQITIRRLQHQLHTKETQLDALLQESQGLKSTLKRVNLELRAVTEVDRSTGLPDRQRFESLLVQQWRKSSRDRILWGDSDQTALSILLLDVAHLVPGSSEGDWQPLQGFVDEVRGVVKRAADVIARYDDACLSVLLPNTPQSGALKVGSKIQALPHALPSDLPDHPLAVVVVTGIPSQAISPLDMLPLAEALLQQAIAQESPRILQEVF